MSTPVLIMLVCQGVLTAITSAATAFAYRAAKDARWLQEVVVPLLTHMLNILDPQAPKPPDPPPITD
jgi:hypothetical protein